MNFIATIFKMRAPGMTLFRMPIFVWTMLVTATLILLATPVLTAGLIALFIDRNYGGSFFDPNNGGNPILWQHIFWFFGHPEVYIVILPAMGMVSEILPVFSRKPLFGYRAFVYATIGIGLLSFSVWAHHMFTTGAVFLPFFSFMTALIAIPTGVKMFNWLATMWRGSISLTTPMLFAIGFLVDVPDRRHQRRDAGLGPGRLPPAGHLLRGRAPALRLLRRSRLRRLRGDLLLVPQDDRPPAERAPRARSTSGCISSASTWPSSRMHSLGITGMPRRIADYSPECGLDDPATSLVDGRRLHHRHQHAAVPGQRGRHASSTARRVGDDPWEGNTLEWATSSPPPPHNFDRLPPIRSERPVFDLRHRHDAEHLARLPSDGRRGGHVVSRHEAAR